MRTIADNISIKYALLSIIKLSKIPLSFIKTFILSCVYIPNINEKANPKIIDKHVIDIDERYKKQCRYNKDDFIFLP